MANDLRNANREEIEKLIAELGQPAYRAHQLFRWVHKNGVTSFSEMTDLPLQFRNQLEKAHIIGSVNEIERQESKLDGTVKLLLGLEDGQTIENVIMPHEDDSGKCTVCVSSQVGCPVGCTFCATGTMGFIRNLSVSEILSQVYIANAIGKQKQAGWQVSNVVFMGMGEPFLNYNEVMKSLRILIDPEGLNIGQRRIVFSTSGYVPGIIKMAQEQIQSVLAVSLHAADNELRDRLVPMNRKYPLEKIAEACGYYNRETGRRITFEYALISGVNDTSECAMKLAEFAAPLRANVNIIPLNDVANLNYTRSSNTEIAAFSRLLNKKGIEAVVRKERGSDIAGACGQLRCRHEEK